MHLNVKANHERFQKKTQESIFSNWEKAKVYTITQKNKCDNLDFIKTKKFYSPKNNIKKINILRL